MANPEHVEILKKGVVVWNHWRAHNPDTKVDLREVRFEELTEQPKAITSTNVKFTNFREFNFINVDLTGAHFMATDLSGTFFNESNLSQVRFFLTNLRFAVLNNANLLYSSFSQTLLDHTKLIKANLTHSTFSGVTIADCNLDEAIGLESILHVSPSSIGIDTIYQSVGKIPDTFLRGCGVPEDFITYAKSLVIKPIDFYKCFISFTEVDNTFSERLYNDLQMAGVRCWHWKEDAKWGRTLRKEIDEAIRYYDKLMIICSKDSLKAPAVLEEIERALNKEDAQKRAGEEGEVLFPIRIDDYIFDGWEHELKVRLTRKNIGDFCNWNSDAEKYRKSVERLVRDLNRPRINK